MTSVEEVSLAQHPRRVQQLSRDSLLGPGGQIL